MGCRCGKKSSSSTSATRSVKPPPTIVAEYKYLRPHQIKARLEVFKRNYCTNCESRYQCDYNMYLACTKKPQ